MKNVFFYFLALSILLSFQSCLEDKCTEQREFTLYTPVYMTKAQFRKDIEVETTRKLENPGKMYFYNQYLFINEQGKGIHIYDINDETNPKKISFYDIPGNFDIAVKDNILYADNVIDLVAIDITDISQPKTVKRIEDYNNQYLNYDPQLYYVYSVRSNQTQILDCSNPNFGRGEFIENGQTFFDSNSGPKSTVINSSNGNNTTGLAGSFAKFAVVNDYLYTIDYNSLKSYLVSNPSDPQFKYKNQIGWGIETIFPYGDKLFVGSNSGMFIFDNKNPEAPVLLSSFDHARACDPVVVNGNIAYVTLRNGNECQGFENQLDVIDITNVLQPKLIKSYPMKNPHGLSYSDGKIYLAEGEYGFKVLDVKDPNSVNELCSINDIHSYDMISLNDKRLFMIGDDGFYQFNVSDPRHPKIVSTIKINE
ncbi:MAG: hypothetical protein IPO92_01455 [Saprospiraceae bacterium]|nr:hypothetical protein [Saprospiraceae bacterium]